MPNRDVAIFWDFESCPVPDEASGYAIVNDIRSAALLLGIIKSFKAYLSLSDHSSNVAKERSLALRSELQCSGVSLTDAPGNKDIASQMVIVDMLAYAFDRPPSSTTLILISSDTAFAYGLSVLRMRNYRTAIMTPPGTGLKLIGQATLCLPWTVETPNNRTRVCAPPPERPKERDTMHLASDCLEHPHAATSGTQTGRDDAASRLKSLRQCPNLADMEDSAAMPPPQHPSNVSKHATSMYEEVDVIPKAEGTVTPIEIRSSGESDPIIVAVEKPRAAREIVVTLPNAASAPVDPKPETQGGIESHSRVEHVSPSPSKDAEAWLNGITSPPTLQDRLDANHPRNFYYEPQPETARAFVNPSGGGEQAQGAGRSPVVPSPSQSQAERPPVYSFFQAVPSQSSSLSEIQGRTSAGVSPEPIPRQASQIPPEFRVLVDSLVSFRSQGINQPGRSAVAIDVISRDKLAYEKAGTSRFAQYSTKAQNLGIIELGGYQGDAWMSLHPSHI